MTAKLNRLQFFTRLVGALARMNIMTRALKLVAGNSMKSIPATMTGNRLLGPVAGALVTAIIRSSSVTTVLLSGSSRPVR